MDIDETRIAPRPIVGIRRTVDDPGELFATATGRLLSWVEQHGVGTDRVPIGVYFRVDEGTYDMAVAVRVDEAPTFVADDMFVGTLGAPHAFVTTHRGPYDRIPASWGEMMATIGDAPLAMPCWEEYLVGPDATEDPGKWRTLLVQPTA